MDRMAAWQHSAAPLSALDEILEIKEQRIRVAKTILSTEPYLAGHYPGYPIFPGVFILETIHQATNYYVTHQLEQSGRPYLRNIRSIKFLTPLGPGDRFETTCGYTLNTDHSILHVKAACFCGETKVAQAELSYLLKRS